MPRKAQGIIRIGVVDHFRSSGWYSWHLYRQVTRILPIGSSLILYGPKGSQSTMEFTGEFKAIWTSFLYPLQIIRQVLKDRINIIHIQFEFVTFGSPFSSILFIPLLLLLKMV